MDPNDLKTWARNNHHRFSGMLHQYLIGNKPIEECLIEIVEKLHPIRDTSRILEEIKNRVEESKDEDLEDWSSWLEELEHMVQGLETMEPPPPAPSILVEKPPVPESFNLLDLIEDGLSTHKGNPLYGSFQNRYYPRVSKETGARIVEHYGVEGDPRKSVGTILPTQRMEGDEYVLIPPQTTVVVRTVERMKLKPSVVAVLSAHPTYQAIGLETQGGTFDFDTGKVGPIEVRITNPKSFPARIYLSHGVCELRFIPQGK